MQKLGNSNVLCYNTQNPVELKHCEMSSSCRVFYLMKLKPEKERYYLILEYDYVTWKPRINSSPNKRIGIFSAEIFPIQVAYFVEILLIQSQVVSSNHFGSRIKHSYLHIYGKLVCRELIITTNVDYMLAEIVWSSFTARGWSEWIMQLNIFAVLWPYVPVNSKTAHAPPSRANPRAFDFFEKFWSNSPLRCLAV